MATQLAFIQQPSVQPASRQRLLTKGASSLTDQELLSVLLGKADVAERLWSSLDEHDRPFHALRQLTPERLMAVLGIGRYKAATILAAVELGRRSFNPMPDTSVLFDDPAIAASALSEDLMWSPVEKFAVLMLDAKLRLISKKVVSIGTATETIAHPRDIFKAAIDAQATRLIVTHNHPSGDLKASDEDIALTRQLLDGSDVLGIPILDHLILGNGNYCSIRQNSDLWMNSAV